MILLIVVDEFSILVRRIKSLPQESIMHRKGSGLVGQMTTISHHATRDGSRRSNGKICQTAIKGTIPQPSFGWQLERPAQKVTNHIGVANNNFDFVVMFLIFHFFIIIRTVKIFVKGCLDAGMIVVCDLDRLGRCSSTRNVVTGAVQYLSWTQIDARFAHREKRVRDASNRMVLYFSVLPREQSSIRTVLH